MSELPPGFVLDGQPTVPSELPAGFVVDGQAAQPKPFGLSDTWPARLAKSIYGAVTLPGDVMQGNVSMTGPDGHTNPEVIGRAAELAAVASPLPAATRAGVGALGAPIAAKPLLSTAPTREALGNAAKEGYEQARGLGVDIRSQPIADLGTRIGAELNDKGVQSELAPKTFSILGKLANPPEGSVASLQNLEALRRTFGHAARDFSNPTEQLAAKLSQRHLDDYLAAIPDSDVIRGPAAEASKILGDARANYAAAQRSGQVTGAVEDAGLQAAAANSGQNIGNATRQRIKSILTSDKKSAGYSDAELAQMEQVVRGTRLGNASRFTGNLLGGGGGLGMATVGGLGGLVTAPYGGVGALLPFAGMALRKMSNVSVDKQANLLDQLIRSRAPLADTVMQRSVPISPVKERIIRSLLGAGLPQQQ